MAWSGSAARLGNKAIRYLVLDELDKYQGSKREASAEALAEKRVITWGKRAITWKLSTPTVVDGPIHKAFAQSEARFRYILINSGQLPHVRVGSTRGIRVLESDVRAFIHARSTGREERDH